MKIIKVLVDELPESCYVCERRYPLAYICDITGDETPRTTWPVERSHRHDNCPLVLEHDNKKIANEVM